MNSLKKQRIVYGILLLLWMAFIFIMSAQPASESSQISGGFVNKIIDTVYPNFDSMSTTQQLDITNTITLIVRKTAHFSEYFVLGVLGFLVAKTHQKCTTTVHMLSSTVFCVLYAVSDEIHQYFVPGRACRFLDVCIDAAGSILATVLLALLVGARKKHKSGELNA